MNARDICTGKVTRQNRKILSEKSAIDFLLASTEVEEQIQKMKIDENCDYVLKGTVASDHNSFIVDLMIGNIEQNKDVKSIKWRLNAPMEKWKQFVKYTLIYS